MQVRQAEFNHELQTQRRQGRITVRVQAKDQGRRQTLRIIRLQCGWNQSRQAAENQSPVNSPGHTRGIIHGRNARKCLHGRTRLRNEVIGRTAYMDQSQYETPVQVISHRYGVYGKWSP